MIQKIIHWVIMPCSQATLYIERNNNNNLSYFERLRLYIHLFSCKWCKNYSKKVSLLDKTIKKIIQNTTSEEIKEDEIQHFKEKVKNKLNL